jgi:exonuclease VII small subunit
MNYKIKITGSGTRDEIIEALKTLVKSLETCDEPLEKGIETFEDETLFTEISEDE